MVGFHDLHNRNCALNCAVVKGSLKSISLIRRLFGHFRESGTVVSLYQTFL